MNTQFPIFLVGNTNRKRRGRRGGLIPHFEDHERGCGRSMIRQLLPEHQALIEGFQPYKRGNGGRNSPLYWLKEVNNANKHRLVQVVAPKEGIGPMVSGWQADGVVRFYRFRFGILKDGARLGEAPIYVHVNPNVVPLVVFWYGCEAVKGKGVCYTLNRIADYVSEIVESLAPEFD